MTDLPHFAPTPVAVTFVGAGPGAAAHLTLGAYRALQEAEVVIHDRLVGAEIMALIPAYVTRVDVGKEGFGPSTTQAAINATLVAHAMTGRRIVRLKGGDCGIFGRLDEEMDALEAANLSFRILPGLTSAAVAAANIGQSLTKRGRNGALRIVTELGVIDVAPLQIALIPRGVRFRVELIAATPNPQQCVYAGMHQDYSEGFVAAERQDWPDEAQAGEICVKRLLAGERGHYGPLEHAQIVLNVGWFPHSVMQQARTHRVGVSFDVQSMRYTGDRLVRVDNA